MNLVGFIRQFQKYLTVSARWVSRFTELVSTTGAEQINVTLHFFVRPALTISISASWCSLAISDALANFRDVSSRATIDFARAPFLRIGLITPRFGNEGSLLRSRLRSSSVGQRPSLSIRIATASAIRKSGVPGQRTRRVLSPISESRLFHPVHHSCPRSHLSLIPVSLTNTRKLTCPPRSAASSLILWIMASLVMHAVLYGLSSLPRKIAAITRGLRWPCMTATTQRGLSSGA